MRRLLTTSLAAFLAASLAFSILVDASGAAKARTPDRTADANSPEPYFQVVDDATSGRFKARGWERGSANSQAFDEGYVYANPSSGMAFASFRVKIPTNGYYTVYARWPTGKSNNAATRFGISTASGVEWTEVNQQKDGGFWVRIGAYEMRKGQRVIQVAGNSSRAGRVVADAVMVVGDALVGDDGRTASYANPDELASDELASEGGAFSAQGGRPTGRDVVRQARRHLGTPYRSSPPGPCRINIGEDCSCLTMLVFKKFGRRLPDLGPGAQWKYGGRVARSNLRPGDLVFFDEDNSGRLGPHDLVGIYSGNGNFVYASGYYKKVVEKPMKWIGNYYGAKRLRLS